METMNGGQGGEDARQIAPVVHATPETWRVWLGLAIVVALALLLPGCSYTAPANPVPEAPTSWPDVAVVVLCLAFVALLVIRPRMNITKSKIDVKWREESDGAESDDGAKKEPDPALRAFDRIVAQFAAEKAECKKLRAEADANREECYTLRGRINGLQNERATDAAALDACAALLDGKPGEREWEAARVALRATGRLGGAIGPCGPGCGNPTSKHDGPCVTREPKS